MNIHQVAPQQFILLGTFTIDVGVDALAEPGIYELLSRPLVSTPRWLRRWRAACAAAFKAPLFEAMPLNAAHSLPLKVEELGSLRQSASAQCTLAQIRVRLVK